MRVIALEEAFLHPKLRDHYPPSYLKMLDMVKGNLGDVGPARIRRMDAAGIDLQVLSHVQPGVQTLDRDTAIRLSKEVNDWLGDIVREYPTRFAGFAMLPTQSPQEAAKELDRAVTELGLRGALINGHTNGVYLDDPSFSPMLERAEALNVPIYIHPTDPPDPVMQTYYKDYQALSQGWGWMVETGTHLLRMIAGGVFDRHPGLKIIVGHMGELIPFGLDRINRSLTMGNWLLSGQLDAAGSAPPNLSKNSFLFYMKQNVFITTSGAFDQVALNCSIAKLGIDNILFSVDDPFADNFEGVAFLKNAQLSDEDREKLAYRNAERVLGLSSEVGRTAKSGQSFYAMRAKAKSSIGRALLSFLVK